MAEIIYEDRALLVVKKPAGMAVQTGRIGQMDLQSEVKNYLKGGYLGIVHRLDQPVEGLVVFAKTQRAAASLSQQFSGTGVHKSYVAYVSCREQQEKGREVCLVDYLIKTRENTARIAGEGEKGAKRAELTYRIEEELPADEALGRIYRLRVELGTGRFHQIRAQLSNAGMPILGDVKYGGSSCRNPEFSPGRIGLIADRLTFLHPETGRVCEFGLT